MVYDEVSIVDAGASDDGEEHGAHVLLMKRAPKEDSGGSVSTKGSTASSPKKVKRQKGTTERAQHWKEDRHPRNPKGPGGGEFKETSSQSKKKYGKGGTTASNLPKEYQAKDKERQSLQHNLSQSQLDMLKQGKSDAAAKSKKKSDAAKSKKKREQERAAKKKQQQQKSVEREAQKKAAQQARAINSLADNQRDAYKKQGKPIPKGYSWSGNTLIPTDDAVARQKAAQGLPAATSGSKKSSSTKGKPSMQLVLGPDGNFRWVAVSKREMSKESSSVTVREKALLSKWLNNTKEGAH